MDLDLVTLHTDIGDEEPMAHEPRIVGIFIAENAGAPMQALASVRAISSIGLEGDRYATGKGAFSNAKRTTMRHVTFIEQETIRDICQNGLPLTAELTRRNFVTRNVRLNELVGKLFSISQNGPIFLGIELCDPCGRPGSLSGDPNLKKHLEAALQNRGGLRASILAGGTIHLNDPFCFPPFEPSYRPNRKK